MSINIEFINIYAVIGQSKIEFNFYNYTDDYQNADVLDSYVFLIFILGVDYFLDLSICNAHQVQKV